MGPYARHVGVWTVLLGLLLVGCAGAVRPAHPPEATPPTGGVQPAGTTPTPAEMPALEEAQPTGEGGEPMAFELRSPAFEHGEPIPRRYTCDGEDLSPPLEWSDPPEGTVSLALIMDDPDAPVGTWDHWVLFDIPADVRSLPEGVPPDAEPPQGGRHGRNSWRRLGYGGPCPPGGTHRYFFRLYALDTALGLSSGAAKGDILKAMEGHVLGQAELMGTYSR